MFFFLSSVSVFLLYLNTWTLLLKVTLCCRVREITVLLHNTTAAHVKCERLPGAFFCPRSLCQVTRGTFKQIGLYHCHGKHASSYWILLFVYLAHAQKLKVISPLLFPTLEYILHVFHTSCNIFHLVQTTTPLFSNVSLSLSRIKQPVYVSANVTPVQWDAGVVLAFQHH